MPRSPGALFFFFKDPATTEIYTLSLHDALPISAAVVAPTVVWMAQNSRQTPDAATNFGQLSFTVKQMAALLLIDRKSTRLNSSHGYISYAVFCLKKKRYSALPATSAGSP